MMQVQITERKFFVYTDVSRTHPIGAGSALKGKRKKKRTQTTGKRLKKRRGEGNKRTSRTNPRGETDLTNTEHTPKPHDTLQRGTGEN